MPEAPAADAIVEFIIQGVTLDGKPFRPSDWAERLCGVMSALWRRPPHAVLALRSSGDRFGRALRGGRRAARGNRADGLPLPDRDLPRKTNSRRATGALPNGPSSPKVLRVGDTD
jgi:hypothetical protein